MLSCLGYMLSKQSIVRADNYNFVTCSRIKSSCDCSSRIDYILASAAFHVNKSVATIVGIFKMKRGFFLRTRPKRSARPEHSLRG